MKRALILVVSSHQPPYEKMLQTSLTTWDSVKVEGVETVYYCGSNGNRVIERQNVIDFPIKESYATMGHKCISAFEWALSHREFDYIARVNSSCYVDKKKLLEYINVLPDSNVFGCIAVEPTKENPRKWAWGGGQFILSKDVVQAVVDNKTKWDHSVMEDVALSSLVAGLNIPYTPGLACSLNEKDGHWLLLAYGGESFEFTEFERLKQIPQFFYRVKIDRDRSIDEYLMNKLYNVLK